MHRPPIGNLVPLGLEIEATIRRNRAERRRKLLQDRTIASILEEEAQSSHSTSSYSLSSSESTTDLPEASVMAEEHQHRVTLEDYSSSSVPQFFKSIAWPKVLAHNINYPHSLNHLIQGNLFHGLPNEDRYTHLATYIEIHNTVKIVGVPDDAIRLSLFSFSLA